jgi:hypothetical protein
MTEKEHLEIFGTKLHVDHVFPLSKGGSLKPGTAILLCARCNSRKRNKELYKLSGNEQFLILNTAHNFWMYHYAVTRNYPQEIVNIVKYGGPHHRNEIRND